MKITEITNILTENVDWYITRAKFQTRSKIPNNIIYAAATSKFKDNMGQITVSAIVDIIRKLESNK